MSTPSGYMWWHGAALILASYWSTSNHVTIILHSHWSKTVTWQQQEVWWQWNKSSDGISLNQFKSCSRQSLSLISSIEKLYFQRTQKSAELKKNILCWFKSNWIAPNKIHMAWAETCSFLCFGFPWNLNFSHFVSYYRNLFTDELVTKKSSHFLTLFASKSLDSERKPYLK